MSAIRRSLTGVFLAGSAFASADPSLQWINKNVFKQIQITGRRVIGYHLQSYQGDSDTFQTLTYYGQGGKTFTDYGQVNVTGRKVLGVLNFQMQLQNNRFGDPQGQRISLNYDKGPVSADVGDIQGSLLNTNQFASFNKTLRGAMAGIHSGRTQLKGLYSQIRGSVRTLSLAGNGSQGPYYLNASQIIPDSEKIMVDGVQMKLGTDYSINYEVGSITFSTKPIAQTSTIVASYETYSYNSNSGTVQGLAGAYNLGRFGKLGVTAMQQTVGGSRSLTSRVDLFQGFGAPATPYFLQFVPLAGYPILIRVDGILQTQGIDYVFDKGNPSIFYFLRFMPATSNIDVTYTPQPTQAVNGDRRVTGLDYTLPLGKMGRLGSINYSQATGQLMDALTPLSGTARGVTGIFNLAGFRLSASERDIPSGFVSIETRGFNRNEKSTDLALDGGHGPVHYGVSTNNSVVSTSNTDQQGNVIFSSGRVTYSRAYVALDQKASSWSLEESRSTSDGASGDTRIDTTGLTNTRKLGKLRLSVGLQRLSAVGPVATLTGISLGTVTSNSVQLKTDYDAGHSLVLSGKGSLSTIQTAGQTGNGSDLSLAAAYHPPGRFSLDTSYLVSRAGELAALSQFQNGLGYGYGGNGFSGAPTGTPFGNGGTDVRAFQAFSTVRISKRMNVESHFIQSDTQGEVSSNTMTRAYGGGLQFDLGKSTAMSTSIDRTHTSYIGTDNASGATTWDTYLSGSPLKRWSFRLGMSTLLSSGTQFSQNRVAFDGGLTRRVSQNQTLGVQFQTGRTTGYLPQDDAMASLLYSYQLYRNVAVVSSYTVRSLTNLDPAQTTGWYRAKGFNVELSFDFGR